MSEEHPVRTIRKYLPVVRLVSLAVTTAMMLYLIGYHIGKPVVGIVLVAWVYGLGIAYWVGYIQGRDAVIGEILND